MRFRTHAPGELWPDELWEASVAEDDPRWCHLPPVERLEAIAGDYSRRAARALVAGDLWTAVRCAKIAVETEAGAHEVALRRQRVLIREAEWQAEQADRRPKRVVQQDPPAALSE